MPHTPADFLKYGEKKTGKHYSLIDDVNSFVLKTQYESTWGINKKQETPTNEAHADLMAIVRKEADKV